eukprot:3168243-Lingulodinium_polyedra.AAC.1
MVGIHCHGPFTRLLQAYAAPGTAAVGHPRCCRGAWWAAPRPVAVRGSRRAQWCGPPAGAPSWRGPS